MSSYRLSVRAPPWFPAPPPALAVEEGAGLVLGWRYSAHPPLAAPPALLHTGPGGAVRRVAGLGSFFGGPGGGGSQGLQGRTQGGPWQRSLQERHC